MAEVKGVQTMNKQALMKEAKAQGIEELQLFERHSKTTSLKVFEQTVDSFTISESIVLNAKGLVNGHMGMVYVEDLSDEAIPFIITSIKENASAITSEDEQEIYAGDEYYPTVEYTKNTCLDEGISKKVELLLSLEKKLQAYDPRIAQVMELAYEDVESGVTITNTKGIDLHREDTMSMLVASILVKDGEDQKSAYEIETLTSLEDFDEAAFVQKLCEKAIKKLHATQVVSGHYPVLIEKNAMGDLLRHVMNQFHGEQAAKGISLLKDSIDQKIFDEKVTIIDDPLMKDGYNSAAFDDEGVACYKKTVVEQGVLKTFLHNLKTAKLMNTTSTGNGFYNDISCTNLYMEAGDTSYEDMVKSMEKGVIITELNGLHAGWNAVTTQFSLQAAGFYVEAGEIVRPVNLITIAGNFLELMKHISIIGNDVKHSYTGIGAPSVLFEDVAVSGE